MQSIFVFSYGLPTEAVNVKDGIITIQKNMLGNYNPAEILEKTKTATSKLKRIKGYNLLEQIENSSPNTSNKKRLEAFVFTTKYDDIVMPNHSLFQPLITDRSKMATIYSSLSILFKRWIFKTCFRT